jgi:outer membrane protease
VGEEVLEEAVVFVRPALAKVARSRGGEEVIDHNLIDHKMYK